MNIQFISSSLCYVFMFQGCKSSVLVGQNVRDVVTCIQCNKQRCIYSEHALSNWENRELKSILHKYSFHCGCMITPDVSFLLGMVFTRLELTCSSPMELPFYANTKIYVQKDICYCIRKGVQEDKELKKQFKTILPLCLSCKEKGKNPFKQSPLGRKKQ